MSTKNNFNLREKILRQAAQHALEIEADLDLPDEELEKRIGAIFKAARRKKEEVMDQVKAAIADEKIQREKKERDRERLAIWILIYIALLSSSQARDLVQYAEECGDEDVVSMRG